MLVIKPAHALHFYLLFKVVGFSSAEKKKDYQSIWILSFNLLEQHSQKLFKAI